MYYLPNTNIYLGILLPNHNNDTSSFNPANFLHPYVQLFTLAFSLTPPPVTFLIPNHSATAPYRCSDPYLPLKLSNYRYINNSIGLTHAIKSLV